MLDNQIPLLTFIQLTFKCSIIELHSFSYKELTDNKLCIIS